MEGKWKRLKQKIEIESRQGRGALNYYNTCLCRPIQVYMKTELGRIQQNFSVISVLGTGIFLHQSDDVVHY